MTNNPIPPLPPPPPRKREGNLLWIVLGVVAFAAVLTLTGAYILARYVASQINVDVRQTARGKSVDVQTPVGNIRVNEGQPSDVGLPIYPGAQQSKSKGANVSIDAPNKGVNVAAAEYETDDAVDKVADFYRDQLGKDFIEKKEAGAVTFTWKSGERHKVVGIKRHGGRTHIGMAVVDEGTAN